MSADAMTELEGLVTQRLGAQVRDLRIVINEQGVRLRGRTETYYAKQLAQHVVMEATDVPILANEIEVT
jgi:hypothetical protein